MVTVALHLDKQPRELAIAAGCAVGGGAEELIGCGNSAWEATPKQRPITSALRVWGQPKEHTPPQDTRTPTDQHPSQYIYIYINQA